MLTLFRYKKNGLPCGLIAVHEFLARDIFNYFEKGRFVRSRMRKAGKSIRAALRFARKKQTFPKCGWLHEITISDNGFPFRRTLNC
jgi:hypothetical protein